VHGRAAGATGQGNAPADGGHEGAAPALDYEYERAGTASVFLFAEPLAGWRQATARARRTKADWAVEVAGLLEGRYAKCEKAELA